MSSPRALIIAECASNHGGDRQAIQELIYAAADSGADVVKFQAYRTAFLSPSDPQFAWLKQAELTDTTISTILATVPNIPKMFSVFDAQRIEQLRRLGVTWFKVGHGDSHRRKLIIPQEGEHWYLSYAWTCERCSYPSNVTPLVTIPLYPAPLEALRPLLRELDQFGSEEAWGYSDHTIGLDAAQILLARGAVAVEKHFSLPTSPRRQPWDMTPEQVRTLREWAHTCAIAHGGTPLYERWLQSRL